MSRQDYIRAKSFLAALEQVPPLIRHELIADRTLNKSFGLEVDAVVELSSTGVEFQRSEIARAIKEVTRTQGKTVIIKDKSGDSWEITALSDEANQGILLKKGAKVLHTRDMALLGEDRPLRIAIFEQDAERTNLPDKVADKWRVIVGERPLQEEELAALAEELADTPIAVSQTISERFVGGGISTDTLVPRSLAYYERLVGSVTTQTTIVEYAAEVAVPFVAALSEWQRINGLKQALLLGTHSLIVVAIAALPISAVELKDLLEWAETSGDAVSRGALIEVALKNPELEHDIAEPLAGLIAVYAGEKEEPYDQFQLFSSAFVMVYGELSQIGVMASKPVYWKRLAAAAQAALICRCVLASPAKLDGFVDWMRGVAPAHYILHCFIDYRTDPMWMGEFGMPNQLKNEFVGRILNVALAFPQNADALGVTESLLGESRTSLKSQINLLLASLSGPLEGNIVSARDITHEDVEKLRAELISAAPKVESFSILVSMVLLAKVPTEFPVLAAEAIRRAQYKFDAPSNPDALAVCLAGLATLAANTRSVDLADALLILVRNYRRNFSDELSIDTGLRVGMIACASRADFGEWCRAIGAFINDFSFGRLSRNEAKELYPLVVGLCNIVPELWAACGEGLAAIESVAF